MNIEIITTPNKTLKETGFGSYIACNSVLDAIRAMGHTVNLNICEQKADLNKIINLKPDLVVLAVKYILPADTNEEIIWLSDYFTLNGINFTGSLKNTLEFDSNKVRAKIHLYNKGIATAKYFTAVPEQYLSERDLPLSFPLFLKPMDAANGKGIDDRSYVTHFSEFEDKILSLYKSFGIPTLVEEYLGGREFTVSVIKQSNGELLVSAIEIIPPKAKNGIRILGEEVKRKDSELLKKIDDTDEIKNKVIQLAVDSFTHLGARDFGRIDIKENKNGQCFFIEANFVPGLTSGSSYFPQSCEIEHGLSYESVVQLMLESGLERAHLATSISNQLKA